jgi:hypothetical protein
MELIKNINLSIVIIIAIIIFYFIYKSIDKKKEKFTSITQYTLDTDSKNKLNLAINSGLQDTCIFYGDDLVNTLETSIINSLGKYSESNKQQQINYPIHIANYWAGLTIFGSNPSSFQVFEKSIMPLSVNLINSSGKSTLIKLSDALISTKPYVQKRECINLCST